MALAMWTARDAEIISRYFGLNGEKASTLEEIGKDSALHGDACRRSKRRPHVDFVTRRNRGRRARICLSSIDSRRADVG